VRTCTCSPPAGTMQSPTGTVQSPRGDHAVPDRDRAVPDRDRAVPSGDRAVPDGDHEVPGHVLAVQSAMRRAQRARCEEFGGSSSEREQSEERREEATHELPGSHRLFAEFDGFRRQLRIVAGPVASPPSLQMSWFFSSLRSWLPVFSFCPWSA
jgi:hypothetical protein